MSWRNAQVVGANVLLRAYFPDEAQLNAQAIVRDHAAGRVQLKAPSLLLYGVSNAVWRAERRGRLTPDQTWQVMASIEDL